MLISRNTSSSVDTCSWVECRVMMACSLCETSCRWAPSRKTASSVRLSLKKISRLPLGLANVRNKTHLGYRNTHATSLNRNDLFENPAICSSDLCFPVSMVLVQPCQLPTHHRRALWGFRKWGVLPATKNIPFGASTASISSPTSFSISPSNM